MTAGKRYPQLRHLDSPLRRIGGPHTAAAGAAAAAADCEHLAPVLSLESVYSTAEASRLFNRLDKLARKTQMQGKGEGPVGRRRRCSSQQQPAAGAAAADAAPAAAAAAAAAEGSERSEGDAFVQPLVMEPKVDGQSMSLTYELLDSSNGNSSGSSSSNSSSSRIEGVARYRLVRALTRGDGQVGEDLTNKAFLLAAAGAFPSEFTAAAPAAASAAAAAAAAAGGGLAWPRVVEVRGEAFVVLEDFEETNAERRRSSQKPFASPRHAVVGLLRKAEASSLDAVKSCRFAAFALVASPDKATHKSSSAAAAAGAAMARVCTQVDLLRRLQEWGFEVLLPHCCLLRGRREALAAYEAQAELHAKYTARLQEALVAASAAAAPEAAARAAAATEAAATEAAPTAAAAPEAAATAAAAGAARVKTSLKSVPCDGVVFKVNALQQQQQLGATARAPRWAFALKFAAVGGETTLLGIEWRLGVSGVCTPVALLQPLLLGGSTVSRASLHSLQEVRRKDIRVGDRVYVQLRGDSVPQVLRTERSSDPTPAAKQQPVRAPTSCPSCGRGLLIRAAAASGKETQSSAAPRASSSSAGDGMLWCPGGWSCEAQRVQRLRRFFSREGVSISGLGPRALSVLTARGYVRVPAHAFLLEEIDAARAAAEGGRGMQDWPGWGPQTRDALFREIRQVQRRGVSLQCLLFALGIPGLGRRAAAALARKVCSFSGFLSLLDCLSRPTASPHCAGDAAAEADAQKLLFTVQEQQQQRHEQQEGEATLDVDSSLLLELRLFGADPNNRQQLLALAKALPIHSVTDSTTPNAEPSAAASGGGTVSPEKYAVSGEEEDGEGDSTPSPIEGSR